MKLHSGRIALAALAGLALLSAVPATAQDYPSKPIKIIAPFPPGPGPDVNTREIAQELSKALRQAVVVENRPGASSMIGMKAGAKATPDGYTLVMGSTSSMSVLPNTHGNKVPHKVDRDHVRTGKLEILALSGKTRHPNLPDVPTFAEVGLPDDAPTAWIGLLAPAGTPAPIVAELGEAMQKAASQNPELIARWRAIGGELRAQTPAEFAAFLKQDDALWGAAIRKAGVKLD